MFDPDTLETFLDRKRGAESTPVDGDCVDVDPGAGGGSGGNAGSPGLADAVGTAGGSSGGGSAGAPAARLGSGGASEVPAAMGGRDGGYPVAARAAPSGAPAGATAAAVASEGAPRSREERLREFYESREGGRRREEQAALAPGARTAAATVGTAAGGVGIVARPVVPGQLAQVRQPTAEEEAEALRLRKLGNDLFESRDFEAAVEHYTTAIKAAPSSTLFSNRAAAYMMLGWWDQALRDTRAAKRRDPDNVRALERHGRVLLAQDQLDDALRVVDDLEARVPESERQDASQMPASLRRLRWLVEHARQPGSLEECRVVLAEFGSEAELLSPLGFRLRTALARKLLERSDAVDNQRRIRPALARNRRTTEDVDEIQEITPLAEEALDVTAKLLADNCPDEADIRLLRGRALARLGRNEAADLELQRGLEREPGHQQISAFRETANALDELKQRGNAAFKEGDLAEAIHLYTLGLDRDPECADTRTCATLYYNRSAARRRRGEFDDALEDVNMALVLHPKWCKALYRRGMLLLECGRYAEALTELKVVQRADPTFDDDLEDWLRRAHNWLSKPKGEVNHYQFMRLPMDSSKEEVRKQYHRLCLQWHPDKSGGTEEGRQRFEDLQQAYRFLMDDERRDRYDFGIWQDKSVRHHVKRREKVKDSWDERALAEEEQELPFWYDDSLLDDKVESIYWGGEGPPEWLKEKRRQFKLRGSRAAGAV